MSGPDQPDAWQKWVKANQGRPHSYHDSYGNSVPDQVVESHRVYGDELDPDWQIDFIDFLKTLPEMQRLAIEKRLRGVPLSPSEHVALGRSKVAVRNWLQLRAK